MKCEMVAVGEADSCCSLLVQPNRDSHTLHSQKRREESSGRGRRRWIHHPTRHSPLLSTRAEEEVSRARKGKNEGRWQYLLSFFFNSCTHAGVYLTKLQRERGNGVTDGCAGRALTRQLPSPHTHTFWPLSVPEASVFQPSTETAQNRPPPLPKQKGKQDITTSLKPEAAGV